VSVPPDRQAAGRHILTPHERMEALVIYRESHGKTPDAVACIEKTQARRSMRR